MKQVSIVLAVSLTLFSCSRREPAANEEIISPTQDSRTIEMETEAQKHVGLKVVPASVTQLTEYLQVTGTVQPIDSKVSRIRPLARGRVQSVAVRIGDRVSAGQVLAELDNLEASEIASELLSANAELRRLRVQLNAQTSQADRNRRLVEIGAAPVKDYEASLAEQRAIEENIKAQEGVIAALVSRLRRFGAENAVPGTEVRTPIQAPFAGVITHIDAAPGEVVDSENELFTVADLSQVWVQAEVYEKDLGRIRVGQSAIITVDTYPEERFAGEVTYISDLLDPRTRTARVRCEVPNPGIRLKLDMFATVQLPTTFSRTVLAVPSSAVHQVEDRNVVFVQREETKFEAREVGIGKLVRDSVEIISGLREGEPVVTEGAFHLKSIVVGKELGEE
ncbi:MAG: efflux RND transporter periplasmic adaptor subunit [Terriglobia bacterium]